MAEETKITIKMGVIASAMAALLVFVLGCLWNQHGRISVVEANQVNYAQKIDRIEQLAYDIRQDQIRREIQAGGQKIERKP